jgi:hypothetical protein
MSAWFARVWHIQIPIQPLPFIATCGCIGMIGGMLSSLWNVYKENKQLRYQHPIRIFQKDNFNRIFMSVKIPGKGYASFQFNEELIYVDKDVIDKEIKDSLRVGYVEVKIK